MTVWQRLGSVVPAAHVLVVTDVPADDGDVTVSQRLGSVVPAAQVLAVVVGRAVVVWLVVRDSRVVPDLRRDDGGVPVWQRVGSIVPGAQLLGVEARGVRVVPVSAAAAICGIAADDESATATAQPTRRAHDPGLEAFMAAFRRGVVPALTSPCKPLPA